MQICCIIILKIRFSHDAQKTLIFDVLIRGKAGFLMLRPKTNCTFDALLRFVAGFHVTCQKLLHLLHYYMTHQKGANVLQYYVEKQVFS